MEIHLDEEEQKFLDVILSENVASVGIEERQTGSLGEHSSHAMVREAIAMLPKKQHEVSVDSESHIINCRKYNVQAMRLMDQGLLPLSFESLQKALSTAQTMIREQEDKTNTPAWHDESMIWLAITYNNLACYYKRQSKLQAALHYLSLAADIESTKIPGSSGVECHH